MGDLVLLLCYLFALYTPRRQAAQNERHIHSQEVNPHSPAVILVPCPLSANFPRRLQVIIDPPTNNEEANPVQEVSYNPLADEMVLVSDGNGLVPVHGAPPINRHWAIPVAEVGYDSAHDEFIPGT